MKHIKGIALLSLTISLLLFSCKKNLDERPDKQLVIPSTVNDLQALLDDAFKMNLRQPSSGEGSADDYFLTYADWKSLSSEGARNTYIWGDELYFTNNPNEWSEIYDVVYVSNIVLEHTLLITPDAGSLAAWNNAKGSALFYRAHSFFRAAQLYTKAYDVVSASSDLGIPLRLNSNFNEPSVRSSVEDTYQQIIKDVKQAIPLLPATPFHKMRPSKPAAFALLARVFLSMRNYQQAGLYADTCLQLYSTLLDYNQRNVNAFFPFSPRFNEEVIFHSYMPVPEYLINNVAKIDSGLIKSYNDNDLRKSLFFAPDGNGNYNFKGSYEGTPNLFTGITSAEVLLIRAECFARQEQLTKALDDINSLLSKRWKQGTFSLLTAANAMETLNIVLLERRKELVMRDIRWMDVKRLNKEGANIIIKRVMNGQTFELLPNSEKYALPLPKYILDITGMDQNPR